MAELNLKQITDKLNQEFEGEPRKLIFWYDENAEFVEDIDSLELKGASIYRLEQHNQFYTKYFLERIDRETNYLIYAPFIKPSARDNHLQDTLLYSKQFFADRASLIMLDLGINERYKTVIEQHIKFFGSKDRIQKFYDLELKNYNRELIEIAMLSVLCKIRSASFDEVLRVVLSDEDLELSTYLAEFEKYDLLGAFWRLCEEQFAFNDKSPTLEKLLITLFVTYTDHYIHAELPKAWQSFISNKSGNIIAFLDSLMNNILYRDNYDSLSEMIASHIKASAELKGYTPEVLLDCDTFEAIDDIILNWVIERLLQEDLGVQIGGLDITAVCQTRIKRHFGKQVEAQYKLLSSAFHIINNAKYSCPDDIVGIMNQYIKSDYQMDSYYREFYYEYDLLPESAAYEKLRDLIENIYTNEYLAKLLPKWNAAFPTEATMNTIPLQREFYNKYIRSNRDKVVVIISDALRFEVGTSLALRLKEDPNCTVKTDAALSVLPSYTRLGMAALLPHKTLELSEDLKVMTDGLSSDDLKQREIILNKYAPNSRCVQFDDIKGMKQASLREIFTGMEVIYVYHNQIDSRGDKAITENEVFTACEEAIQEIYGLIKRLSGTANVYHFIVTADHGFIYKRDKLNETDKIGGMAGKGVYKNRRYIISDEVIHEDGVAYSSLGWTLGNNDQRMVSYPVSSNVFKVPGGGQNYVHGGSSPQEMIIPVIDVKTQKGTVDTKPAQIMLVSMAQKITNLIATFDFIQSEPVSDVVKAANYKIFFISEENEKISNECIYVADSKESDPSKRIFRQRFNFKNQKYDKNKKYYLVAYDEKNDTEALRHEVVMDLAFADDFGFNR